MRFDRIEIRNYKGVAFAELDGLASEAVVTISGRNGTGKSLLLEALVGAWTQRYSMAPRVGPWGDDLLIRLSVSLTDSEWNAVDAWHDRFQGGGPAPRDDLTFTVTANRAGSWGVQQDTAVLQTLRNTTFQRSHPFSVVDFLPANRLVPNVPTPSVDLGMLNIDRVEQDRNNMLDQFINNRTAMSLPSVANYLVTLDYQAFLAARQGLTVEDDYDRLATAFNASTDKTLLRPEYDPARGSNIEIELPTSQRHGLSDLSSGEQEMLAMMYFVRRLSAAGGVLCIDEPEQHLHPTLQAALFETMQGLANRAQVLLVSHSANLIAAAPMTGLVQVERPFDQATNQISRLSDHPEKVALVAALGITPADLFQSDVLLVVEGDTDAQWLRALFPVELGRAHVMIAGGSSGVLDAHETLTKVPAGVPWLCLRDRDLLTDDEVSALQARYSGLHIWPRRALESLLLEPALIVSLTQSLGVEITIEQVEGWLAEAAEPLKDEVLAQIVDREVTRRHPAPAAQSSGTRFEKMEAQLRAYAEVNTARADAVEDVTNEQRVLLDASWPTHWRTWVNPKPVVEVLTQRVGALKTSAALLSALVVRAREDSAVRPQALEDFRLRVEQLLQL